MYISSPRGTHIQLTEMLAYVEGIYLPLALNIVTLALLEIINVTRIYLKKPYHLKYLGKLSGRNIYD